LPWFKKDLEDHDLGKVQKTRGGSWKSPPVLKTRRWRKGCRNKEGSTTKGRFAPWGGPDFMLVWPSVRGGDVHYLVSQGFTNISCQNKRRPPEEPQVTSLIVGETKENFWRGRLPSGASISHSSCSGRSNGSCISSRGWRGMRKKKREERGGTHPKDTA